MLLVLDNLEQLLPDAASVVKELTDNAPDLHVLVTSPRTRCASEAKQSTRSRR